MYEPKTLAEAIVLIKKLRNKEQKFFNQMCVAKARVYDMIMKFEVEPSNVELKEEIIRLKDDLRHAARVRDEALERAGEKRMDPSEKPEEDANTEV